MKKIYTIAIVAILFTIVTSCSAQVNISTQQFDDNWTGEIRIEGSQETIYQGTITITDTYYYAKNVDTNQTEQHYIEHPSVLGALIKASENAGFTYELEYWPSWDATLIKTIQTDSDWWHYYIDYQLPMTSADKYQLQQNNKEILIGYLENWNAHALKIQIDKEEVHKNEEFTVTVYNETDCSVEDATIYIGSETYNTDSQGTVTTSLSDLGNYKIYSEKDGYIRSEKLNIQVIKRGRSRSLSIDNLDNLLDIFPILENLLKLIF